MTYMHDIITIIPSNQAIKRVRIGLATLLILIVNVISAQESMTLPKALSIALENNLDIKIADTNILIAESNNTWAQAGKTPTVSLNGYFNNNIVNNNNPASFLQGAYYAGTLGGSADANWVVYAGGRFEVAKDQLELLVRQEELNKDVNTHDLLRNVYQQYYNVLFQQQRLEVLRESYSLSQSKLRYEQVKKEYGTSNSLNIIQFENALATDSINIVTQSLQVNTAKQTLYSTLLVPLTSDYVYAEVLSVTDEAINAEKLQDALSEDNYTLKSLYILSDLNALNTRLAQAQRKPIVSLNGSLGIAESGFKIFDDNPMTGDPFEIVFGNQITGGINAAVTWDLYDGGVRKTAIETAQLEEEIAKLSVEQAAANLINQLDILIANYQSQRQLLRLTDDQIRLAEENLSMLDERFKGGLVTSLDYRTVQLQYLNAAFAKVNAIYNLILTKSEIDYLVGKFD